MGLVYRRELLARLIPLALVSSILAGCGEVEDPRRAVRNQRPPPIERLEPDSVEPAVAELFAPPVENGMPMPPRDEAGGVPPYPNATVFIRNRQPQPTYRIEAFTFDAWDQVVEFYRQELPTWNYRQARDTAIFEKEPDQAAITVAPWDYEDLPADAPEVLRRARTSIGAAWR